MVLGGGQHQTFSRCTEVFRLGNDAVAAAGSGGVGAGRSRPVKKPKERRVPQRGLGVAQLEKIRLEEQQRSVAASFSNVSSSSVSLSSGLVIPLPPMVRVSNQSSSIAPAMPIPSDPFSQFLIPKPPLPSDGLTRGPLELLPRPQNSFEISPSEAETGGEIFDLSFTPENELSDHFWWSSRPVQRRPLLHKHHQHLRESELPDSSSGNSSFSSLSSGVKLQMEPPSNQTRTINLGTPDDEKNVVWTVGVKRPRSFPFHSQPENPRPLFKSPSLLSSFHSAGERSGKSTVEHSILKLKHESPDSREVPPTSGAFHVALPASPNVGFLSLCSSTSVASRSMFIQPAAEYYGDGDGALLRFGGSDKRPFYTFLPLSGGHHETRSEERQRGEDQDHLDLRLKL